MDYLTKDQVDVLKQEIDILISNKYQSTKTELVRDSTLRELESRRAGEHEDARHAGQAPPQIRRPLPRPDGCAPQRA